MRAADHRGRGRAEARAKLRAAVEQHVADPDERAWVEPRLQHLLGLDERTRRTARTSSRPGGCSSSGWPTTARWCSSSRTSSGPTPGSLDFIEYLLEWSRARPIFVLALARPELSERHPGFGAERARDDARRSSRSPDEAMDALLDRARAGPPRRGPRGRSATAPTASRSTRSRRCGCCSTAACSSATATCTGRRATRGARRPGDAACAGRRAARRPRAGGARGCSRTPPCSARRSRTRARRASAAPERGRRARARRRSSARRCSRSTPTRARPSAASTASSRRSSSGSPTRRSPGATAGAAPRRRGYLAEEAGIDRTRSPR